MIAYGNFESGEGRGGIEAGMELKFIKVEWNGKEKLAVIEWIYVLKNLILIRYTDFESGEEEE